MFKKPLFFYLGLFLMFASTQASWVLQHSGMNPLYGIDFSVGNITTGYACGAQSLLLKTTNGGDSWISLTIPQPSGDFHAVNFPLDSAVGYLACDSGNVIKIKEAGATIIRTNTGTTQNLYGIHFPRNTDIGYAVGVSGVIKKTSNGGETWEDVSLPSPVNLHDVYFVTTTKGWAVGEDGRIFYTFNGGRNWGMQSSPVTERLFDIFFQDTLRGWIVGSRKTCLRTVNGGQTWTEITNIPFSGDPDLHSILFIPGTLIGFICGTNGVFARTDNDGRTWDTVTISASHDFYRLVFPLNSQIGWICGSNEAIFKTTDGGISWIEEVSPQLETGKKLFACEPNPVRSNTKIRFAGLSKNASLKVFNCSGALIRNLTINKSGVITWNGRDEYNRRVSPGVYLLELKTEEGISQRAKITLLN